MDNVLEHLRGTTPELAQAFRIGVTLDPQLKTVWRSRSTLGIASPFGTLAAVTAQPSFPEAMDWNSIEEALTLVHEIGHLFGAGHASSRASVMYPSSGSLSFQFDELNKKIIDTLKQQFFTLTEEQRLQQCITLLAHSRSSTLRNTVNIIPQVAQSLLRLEQLVIHYSFGRHDTNTFSTLVTKHIADSSFRFAVKGYIEYKKRHFDTALEFFTKVIDLQPDFAEVHGYLSEVLRMLNRPSDAEAHRKIAEDYRIPWTDE